MSKPHIDTVKNITGCGFNIEGVFISDSLVLKFPGEFILCLFKFLSGYDMFINDITNLCLHRLQLGVQLRNGGENKMQGIFMKIIRLFYNCDFHTGIIKQDINKHKDKHIIF